MFNDKDTYTADIFQRRLGEDSDSNDDSDILEGIIKTKFLFLRTNSIQHRRRQYKQGRKD